MAIIQYDIEGLRNRASRIKLLANRYEDTHLKLNQVMEDLSDMYYVGAKEVMSSELNLASSMQQTAIKLEKLAFLLEKRAEELEHESAN